MDKNLALIVAGTIFALVALMHLLRLMTKFEIRVAGRYVPLSFNLAGFIVAILLAIYMFTAAR